MTSLQYTDNLCSIVASKTGIDCYNDANLETFNGQKNEVLILHLDGIADALALNNTHLLSYTLSYVIAPETMASDDALQRITDAYHHIRNYFLTLPRYTEWDGAYFLQYNDGQMQYIPDGNQSILSWKFELVVHFD